MIGRKVVKSVKSRPLYVLIYEKGRFFDALARTGLFFLKAWGQAHMYLHADTHIQMNTCPMKSVKKSILQRKAVHPSR